MPKHAASELYRSFLEYVGNDLQHERSQVNRRMFSVFLWCFLLPAIAVACIILLIKIHVLPRSSRGLLDWLILVFPIVYSLYILGTELLVGIPAIFRRGGMATSLQQSLKDHAWRQRVSDGLRGVLHADESQWRWIASNFRIDLDNMRYRTRYLTALAGAVFFLIMQGIDSIGTTEEKVTWVKGPLGWMESGSSDMQQFVGLALFLVLLYVSGNQTHHSLSRYLDCVEVLALEAGSKTE